MSIRTAAPGDLARVREIAQAAYLPYVAAIGKKPAPMVADFTSQITNGQVWIFSDEETVLGYVVAYPSGDATTYPSTVSSSEKIQTRPSAIWEAKSATMGAGFLPIAAT